jgi:hypothetical protein
MILATATTLLLLFAAPLVVMATRRERGEWDLFSPVTFVAGMHMITVVPYLVFLALDEDAMLPLVRHHPSVPDVGVAVVRFGVIQAIGFLALLAGLAARWPALIARRLPAAGHSFSPVRAALAVTTALLIGGGSYAVFLSSIGGYDVLLYNLDRRTLLAASSGYLLSLLSMLLFAVLILIYAMRGRRTALGMAATGTLMLATAAVYSSFGGRLATVQLGLFALLTWHYGVRRIRRIPWQAPALALLLVPYLVAMPILRSPGAFAYYTERPQELGQEILANLERVVIDLSYVDTYVFITSHFNVDNLWLGRVYLDLLLAPIPSGIYAEKPPVDDGVYVATLLTQRDVTPGTPFADLVPTSCPPETLGTMYMNFWLPGVILGMYLLGGIYRAAYRYMQCSGYNLFSIVLYGYVILVFGFSNLRIVGTLVNVSLMTLFFAAFFGCSSVQVFRCSGAQVKAGPALHERLNTGAK